EGDGQNRAPHSTHCAFPSRVRTNSIKGNDLPSSIDALGVTIGATRRIDLIERGVDTCAFHGPNLRTVAHGDLRNSRRMFVGLPVVGMGGTRRRSGRAPRHPPPVRARMES